MYRPRQSSDGGAGILLLLLLVMLPMMAAAGYVGFKKYKGEDPFDFLKNGEVPLFQYSEVNGVPTFTRIEPSDCKGTEYVKKRTCHNKDTGRLLDGSEGFCGDGVEEWVLDPNASGYEAAKGTGKCESDFRPCNVPCDKPCEGNTWTPGACMRNGVVLDGSEDKCGQGMLTNTLDETAADYKPAQGKGTCTKNYGSACFVDCPVNVVPPKVCTYQTTWQKSANGCVKTKNDKAAPVGYDESGWQELFKVALEGENCEGENRLVEWETCTGPPAPVDCEGTWGPNDGWGPCVGSCGTQPSKSRTYKITKEAANGGTQCPYADGEVDTRNCGTIVPCPVDCEGDWSDPPCPTACGTAATSINRTWYLRKPKVGSGKDCPADPGPKQCPATAACPADCEGEWSDPSCPTACGTPATSINRTWYLRNAKVGNGKDCPADPGPKQCPATEACPVDCAGYYTDPPCPTKCGKAASTLTTTWKTLTNPVGTGKKCPSATGTKNCPATEACPPCIWDECKDWSWDYNPCYRNRSGSLPNMYWDNAMSSYELKEGCENWEMRAYDGPNYTGDYFVMQRGGRKSVPHKPHGASVEWNDRVGSVKAVPI